MFKVIHKSKCLSFIMVPMIPMMASLFLTIANVSAVEYSASLTTSESLTVNTAPSINGSSTVYARDNLTVFSDCPAGYMITMQTTSADPNLYLNGDNTSETIYSYSETAEAEHQTSGEDYDWWGYTTNPVTTSIAGLPGFDQTPIMAINSGAATSSTGDNIPIYYGVNISNKTKTGNYRMSGDTSAIRYYLTTNLDCTSYVVAFNANGGSGYMDPERIAKDELVALNANAFMAPTGYDFAGWNTMPNGNGISYYDREKVTNIASVGETLTLYAQWTETRYLQEVSDWGSSITSGQEIIVTDTRDGSKYRVSRLADGRLWMLDNLALDIGDLTVQNNLSSLTTNASDSTLDYFINGGGTSSDRYATSGITEWPEGYGRRNYSYSVPLFAKTGDCEDLDECVDEPEEGKWDKDAVLDYNEGPSKIGAYYNYCAASAGSYCYGDGTSSGTASGNAEEDICPAGWNIPSGGSDGDFQTLAIAIAGGTSSTTEYVNQDYSDIVDAMHLPLSGYFGRGEALEQYYSGSWWSSTLTDGTAFGLLNMSDGATISPQESYDRSVGNSIRCVAKFGIDVDYSIDDLTYLQDFAGLSAVELAAVKLSMPVGTTFSLIDNRDNESYDIARLEDNNIWLLDNLRLDLTDPSVQSNLTSSTTNASDETLAYLKGTTSRDPDSDPDGQYATAGVANWSSAGEYTKPLIASSGTYERSANESGVHESGLWDKDDTISYGNGTGKIGVLYNFCAATAGSICYNRHAQSTYSATEDICPVGWGMPGDYTAITSLITGIDYDAAKNGFDVIQKQQIQNGLHLVMSGFIPASSAVNNSLYDGGAWHAKYNIEDEGYISMGVGGMFTWGVSPLETLYPSYSFNRSMGATVRCTLGGS